MVQDYEIECPSKKGWLLKWTNFVKGYRRRWFVLSNGTLFYYRTKAEAAYMLRGSLSVMNILIHTYNTASFVLSKGDSKETFYLKAADVTERQYWVTALEITKIWVANEADKDSFNLPWLLKHTEYNQEVMMSVSKLGSCLENIQRSNATLAKQGKELKMQFDNCAKIKNDEIPLQQKTLTESANLFQEKSNDMVSSCNIYLEVAQKHYHICSDLCKEEVTQRKDLKELVDRLDHLQALLQKIVTEKTISLFPHLQALSLEESKKSKKSIVQHQSCAKCTVDPKILNSTRGHRISILTDERDDISISVEDLPSLQTIPDDLREEISRRGSKMSVVSSKSASGRLIKRRTKTIESRRLRIPDKPNYPLNLWSIMKNCIGKDLSKIPMPVNFSEPLSFLQRVAEDFTYSDVLDQAAECQDSLEELAYLAAFTVSCYATTAYRTAKPFNPLLGETFEWDRTYDLGWKLVSEQVSHHPPIAAQYCEGKAWTCWQEFSMTSKFRGKYLMVVPLGISHIIFHNTNNHYSWNKVTTTVNNIILGKLWVDNTGDTDIISHSDSTKCHITYLPYSMFKAEDQRKVIGEVTDSNGDTKWIIKGKWDSEVIISPVISKFGKAGNPEYKTGVSKTVWMVTPPPEDCHKYYNLSVFACQLNEMEDGIAPTDSRNRPDQRLMEEGKWDEANITKTSLEEKQRLTRKKLIEQNLNKEEDSGKIEEETQHVYEAKWFKTELDSITGRITYVYKGGYWEAKDKQDWTNCPDIF